MKKNMYWIALAALVIPALARGLWFYRGAPSQPKISTPDYQSLTISQPPLETPSVEEDIKQTSGIVLFDVAHSNQYQTSEIRSLKEAIEKRGGKVETAADSSSLEYKLKYASTYVVISPSSVFTDGETKIVRDFVNRGGRLLVFADATRGVVYFDSFSGSAVNYSDAGAVNPLLSPFGITVNNDYLYNVDENEGNFRNVFFDIFGKNELTFGLKRVALYGTHSVKSPSGLTLLRGTESTLSSINDAHDPAEGGAALSENGNVLAFGDFTFLTFPYHNVADNAALIANIADFALGGRQIVSLANFPFIFTQSVLQVYPTAEAQLTAETISALSGLQSALSAVNISVEIMDKAPHDGDTLALGTFTPSDDLANFTDSFNIEFDEFSETLTIKGFGVIGRAGNGLLLFEKNKNGNSLTLLANSPEDLLSLLSTLTSGSLSNCVLQDSMGICSVGFGGSFSKDGGEGFATEEPISGDAPVEPGSEATPTPGG